MNVQGFQEISDRGDGEAKNNHSAYDNGSHAKDVEEKKGDYKTPENRRHDPAVNRIQCFALRVMSRNMRML
jgi:hypothetical protein